MCVFIHVFAFPQLHLPYVIILKLSHLCVTEFKLEILNVPLQAIVDIWPFYCLKTVFVTHTYIHTYIHTHTHTHTHRVKKEGGYSIKCLLSAGVTLYYMCLVFANRCHCLSYLN
jgi:hypothetical protein